MSGNWRQGEEEGSQRVSEQQEGGELRLKPEESHLASLVLYLKLDSVSTMINSTENVAKGSLGNSKQAEKF